MSESDKVGGRLERETSRVGERLQSERLERLGLERVGGRVEMMSELISWRVGSERARGGSSTRRTPSAAAGSTRCADR
jgi:hypothetical protein